MQASRYRKERRSVSLVQSALPVVRRQQVIDIAHPASVGGDQMVRRPHQSRLGLDELQWAKFRLPFFPTRQGGLRETGLQREAVAYRAAQPALREAS